MKLRKFWSVGGARQERPLGSATAWSGTLFTYAKHLRINNCTVGSVTDLVIET